MANGAVEIYKSEEPIPCKVAAGGTVTAGRVVKLSGAASYEVVTGTAASVPLGVAMHDADGNNPDANFCPVALQGVWRLVASGAIDEGALVITGASGKVATIGGGSFAHVVGRAVTASANDNDPIEVLLSVA